MYASASYQRAASAMCALLEIPLRGFPSRMKLHDKYTIPKNNKHSIRQRISFEKELHVRVGLLQRSKGDEIGSALVESLQTVCVCLTEGPFGYSHNINDTHNTNDNHNRYDNTQTNDNDDNTNSTPPRTPVEVTGATTCLTRLV